MLSPTAKGLGSRLPTPRSEDGILRKMLMGLRDAHRYDHFNSPARLRPVTTAVDVIVVQHVLESIER